jgi:cyanophycin synthetase
VLEVFLAEGDPDPVPAWREALKRAHAVLGWPRRAHSRRTGEQHLALAIETPPDCLRCATRVNEWALAGGPEDELPGLVALTAQETNAPMRTAIAEAERRDLPWFADAEGFTVGLGRGAVTVPCGAGTGGGVSGPPGRSGSGVRVVAAFHLIPWDDVQPVPVVLVTGSSGTKTTVRLLARMAHQTGFTVGITTSDGTFVDDTLVQAGEEIGPEGAHRMLRHPRVTFAILEITRDGVLRHGLPLLRVDAAVITNVSTDHIGAHGIETLAQLAEVKLVVAKAARHMVLNADDPELAGREACSSFSLVQEVDGAWLDGEHLVCGPLRVPLTEVPITSGGSARHHVSNALTAMATARAVGIPDAAIVAGLREFDLAPEDNPGRAPGPR